MNRIALTLATIGALNWGSIGLFKFDFLSAIFGGMNATFSRIVFTLIGIAGIWCVGMLFSKVHRD